MSGRPSGTEVAVVGIDTRDAIDGWVAGVVQRALGTGVARVLFRSGRIDAVYGVSTDDGRDLVVRVHRPPTDPAGRATTTRAQRALADARFPVPVPVAGPLDVDGRWVSVETLISGGEEPDGHDPALGRQIAGEFARHVTLLRRVPGLVAAVGTPPAWCRHAGGPWPTPHDTIFDFRVTPAGYAWLDDVARTAAQRIAGTPDPDPPVAAHADWYCGNLRFTGTRLVAAIDWDLVADSPAVVAGLTAGMYSAGSTDDGAVPTPAEVVGFLQEVEQVWDRAFTAAQQQRAAAAATWNLAYAARCQLAFTEGEPDPRSALGTLALRAAEYLDAVW